MHPHYQSCTFLGLTQIQEKAPFFQFKIIKEKRSFTWWKSPEPEPAELPEVLLTRTGTLSIIRRSLTSKSSSSSLKTSGVYSTIAFDAVAGGRGGFDFPGAAIIWKSPSLGFPVDIFGIYRNPNFSLQTQTTNFSHNRLGSTSQTLIPSTCFSDPSNCMQPTAAIIGSVSIRIAKSECVLLEFGASLDFPF